MTNQDSGRKLLQEAVECADEMRAARERGSWNMVVRRAQEVVELSIKGLLKIMGVEYPKVHNPAGYFLELAEKKGLNMTPEEREKLATVSAELAAKRAPAFYFDMDFTEREASEAVQAAEFVTGLTERIRKQLIEG